MFSAEREESVFLTTDLSCRFEVEIANLVVISPGMESVAAGSGHTEKFQDEMWRQASPQCTRYSPPLCRVLSPQVKGPLAIQSRIVLSPDLHF